MHDDLPKGIAGFGTNIMPLLFVSFNFQQLSLAGSTTAFSIFATRSILFAATAEMMRSQAGRKILMPVNIGRKSVSGKPLAICPAGAKSLAIV